VIILNLNFSFQNEIRQTLANYDDIVTRRTLLEKRPKLPTVRELFDPVSVCLPSNHVLGDLLKGAAKDALDNLKCRNEPQVGEESEVEQPIEEPQESAAEIARRSSVNIQDQVPVKFNFINIEFISFLDC
jgi:hypothetical protein